MLAHHSFLIQKVSAIQSEQILALRRDMDDLRGIVREVGKDIADHKGIQIHPGVIYRMSEVERRMDRIEQLSRK